MNTPAAYEPWNESAAPVDLLSVVVPAAQDGTVLAAPGSEEGAQAAHNVPSVSGVLSVSSDPALLSILRFLPEAWKKRHFARDVPRFRSFAMRLLALDFGLFIIARLQSA